MFGRLGKTLGFGGDDDATWFTVEEISDEVEEGREEEKLYCLTVDSPTHQFLIGGNDIPTHNSDEAKEEDQLKGEASQIIGSIARLGRAAGIHLVLATQRPDSKILLGETKSNLGVRIGCGTLTSMASTMILESSEGTRIRGNPRGRMYVQIYGKGNHGQGFYADPDWIDKYLEGKGLNPDGSPLGTKRSRLINTEGMIGDAEDLDTFSGVDSEAIVEQIESEEAGGFGFEDDETLAGEALEGQTSEVKHNHLNDWDDELASLIEENRS